MTIKEFYRNYLVQLQNIYSTNESTKIADMVFEKIAAVKKKDIIISPDQILNESTIHQLTDALQQLLLHKPVQYILGEAWFCDMKFKVDEHVLIPRPETEELVSLCSIYDLRFTNGEPIQILDIGTGSGCIAVTIKKKLPNCKVTAIDVSEDALQVAKENALLNEAEINFKQIDFLDETTWAGLPIFDAIVSNPPYIPFNEKKILDKNVTQYEPGKALFVPDNSPLLFYEKIAEFAKTHLNPDGKIYVEIHEDLGNETAEVFLQNFMNVEIKKDIFGKDRMIRATQFR